jgi:hypothetical protein
MNTIVDAKEFDILSWSGIKIDLENGERLELSIDNRQDCCEEWGYKIVEGKLKDLTETKARPGNFEIEDLDMEEGRKIRVTFYIWVSDSSKSLGTTKKIGLVVDFWNSHNGYYPHNVLIYDSTDASNTKLLIL